MVILWGATTSLCNLFTMKKLQVSHTGTTHSALWHNWLQRVERAAEPEARVVEGLRALGPGASSRPGWRVPVRWTRVRLDIHGRLH